MPRQSNDRFDDQDDIVPTGNGKSPGWTIALLIALPIGAVALVVCVALYWTWESPKVRHAEAKPNATLNDGNLNRAMNRIYTRSEFKGLVIGSTPDDVKVTIGPPSFTLDEGRWSTWHYHNITRDRVTGALDPIATVLFDNGVVVAVDFQAADASSKTK